MLVYLGLSSHGYGHASRQAAVLQALHSLQPDWRLVVSSAVDQLFLQVAFQGLPVEFRTCRWDVGMVQADALACDQSATLRALAKLDQVLPGQIEQEADWITAQDQSVLVLADIPPALAELASRLEAPLVWLGNFGWDDIYFQQGEGFQQLAERARQAYQLGDLLLRMPFDLAMNWGIPEQRIALTAAKPNALDPVLLDELLTPAGEKVLMGFGGLGLTVRPELFALWPDHHFFLPHSPELQGASELHALRNVRVLPPGVRPLDVMPYCQRLIGKPGFSTFSEALSAGLGLHVVERSGFAEASVLLDGLKRHGRYRILSRDAFDRGCWELDQPLQNPSSLPLGIDGAQQAAEAIRDLVLSERSP